MVAGDRRQYVWLLDLSDLRHMPVRQGRTPRQSSPPHLGTALLLKIGTVVPGTYLMGDSVAEDWLQLFHHRLHCRRVTRLKVQSQQGLRV